MRSRKAAMLDGLRQSIYCTSLKLFTGFAFHSREHAVMSSI